MRPLLLFVALAGLLSTCQPIELSVHQTPILEQDVPYKTYTDLGNVCQAADGGFATVLMRTAATNQSVSSSSTAPYVSRQEVAVVKTDAAGQIQWTKLAWAGIDIDNYRPMMYALADGSYLVFLTTHQYGQTEPYGTYQHLVRIQLSNSGEVLSKQVVDAARLNGSFRAQALFPLGDKGFIISGFMGAPFLMRFDKQGQWQWSRSYPQVTPTPNAYGLAATDDGGLLLSWSAYVNGTYLSYLLKTDAAGQQAWLRQYALFQASLVSGTPDQGYALLGVTSSANKLVLFKLDRDGNVQWTQVYTPGSSQSYTIPLGIFAQDGTYVLAFLEGSRNIVLLTASSAGVEQSRQSVTDAFVLADYTSAANSVFRAADGTFLFLGRTQYTSIRLTKTKPDKSIQWSSTIATND